MQRTLATTADNIELIISATVTWRIVDVLKAAVRSPINGTDVLFEQLFDYLRRYVNWDSHMPHTGLH